MTDPTGSGASNVRVGRELVCVEGVYVTGRAISATAASKELAFQLMESWVAANPTVPTAYHMSYANKDGTYTCYRALDQD